MTPEEITADCVLKQDKNHDHYWIADEVLYESYQTIRGLRYRKIMNVKNEPDNEFLCELELLELQLKFKISVGE